MYTVEQMCKSHLNKIMSHYTWYNIFQEGMNYVTIACITLNEITKVNCKL